MDAIMASASSEENGTCARIPQATPAFQARTIQSNPSCHVKGYSTRVVKNLLFAWLWPEDCLVYATEDWWQPEHMTAFMEEGAATYTRDAQYGYDTLLENIMDLSHLPWVHHGRQGTRQDASCMNMTILGKPTEQGFEYTYDDRTRGMDRSGIMRFRAPYLTSVYGQMQSAEKATGQAAIFNINVIQIPTKPGWSRAIFCGPPAPDSLKGKNGDASIKDSKKESGKKSNTSLRLSIINMFPRWVNHQLVHGILDGDIIILHHQEQERFVRRQVDHGGYCIPAPSDRFVVPIRR